MLNPKIDKDSSGTYWLRWTPDASAEGYAFVAPGGKSRTFDPTRKEAKLGKNLVEPVVASVAVLDVTSRTAETATWPPAAPPDPPSMSNREKLGVCMWKAPYGDSEADFTATIANTGAGFVRFDFAGSVIRPNSTTWSWSRADTVVNRAIAAGVKVLATCAYAPSWMNGGQGNDKYPPLDSYFSQYAQIAAEVERRYAATLMGIETWNEPWLSNFWLPVMQPSRFLALSKAQAEAVWAVNPNRDISVNLDYWGQGANAGKQFASAVVAADTTGWLKHPRVVINTHNYCEAASPQTVRGTGWSFDRWKLARTQSGNPRVWVTEYGWKGPGEVTEATAATYIRDGTLMMLADGVERVAIFGVAFPGADGNWGYNLRRADGTWKPAAAAFKAIAEKAT